jgi:hypothetical protein
MATARKSLGFAVGFGLHHLIDKHPEIGRVVQKPVHVSLRAVADESLREPVASMVDDVDGVALAREIVRQLGILKLKLAPVRRDHDRSLFGRPFGKMSAAEESIVNLPLGRGFFRLVSPAFKESGDPQGSIRREDLELELPLKRGDSLGGFVAARTLKRGDRRQCGQNPNQDSNHTENRAELRRLHQAEVLPNSIILV